MCSSTLFVRFPILLQSFSFQSFFVCFNFFSSGILASSHSFNQARFRARVQVQIPFMTRERKFWQCQIGIGLRKLHVHPHCSKWEFRIMQLGHSPATRNVLLLLERFEPNPDGSKISQANLRTLIRTCLLYTSTPKSHRRKTRRETQTARELTSSGPLWSAICTGGRSGNRPDQTSGQENRRAYFCSSKRCGLLLPDTCY